MGDVMKTTYRSLQTEPILYTGTTQPFEAGLVKIWGAPPTKGQDTGNDIFLLYGSPRIMSEI